MSINSEAFASELLEILNKCFFVIDCPSKPKVTSRVKIIVLPLRMIEDLNKINMHVVPKICIFILINYRKS